MILEPCCFISILKKCAKKNINLYLIIFSRWLPTPKRKKKPVYHTLCFKCLSQIWRWHEVFWGFVHQGKDFPHCPFLMNLYTMLKWKAFMIREIGGDKEGVDIVVWCCIFRTYWKYHKLFSLATVLDFIYSEVVSVWTFWNLKGMRFFSSLFVLYWVDLWCVGGFGVT